MKRQRVNLTVSERMMVALEVLAERQDLSVTTVARQVLRAGLQRTMESAEVVKRMTPAGFMSRDQWVAERAAIAADLKEDERGKGAIAGEG